MAKKQAKRIKKPTVKDCLLILGQVMLTQRAHDERLDKLSERIDMIESLIAIRIPVEGNA